MEEKLNELSEKLDLLSGICQGLLDRIINHEALQVQKEMAIYDHIESVRRKAMNYVKP